MVSKGNVESGGTVLIRLILIGVRPTLTNIDFSLTQYYTIKNTIINRGFYFSGLYDYTLRRVFLLMFVLQTSSFLPWAYLVPDLCVREIFSNPPKQPNKEI